MRTRVGHRRNKAVIAGISYEGAASQVLFGVGLRCQLICRKLLGRGQRFSGTSLHIGFYACPFPITFRHRVDGTAEGHTNGEVVVRRHGSYGMGAAARGLAYDGGALLVSSGRR